MSDFLPREIFFEILLRLPHKALLQCTTVCKSWNSMITSPNFITTHLNRTTLSYITNNNTPADLLLLRQYFESGNKERYSLRRDNETLRRYARLEFPFESQNPFFRIVGSCNGLLCLSDDFGFYTYTIILYNPSIRKSVTLPGPRVTFKTHGPYKFALGFGFDAKHNDHKVVRIANIQGPVGLEYIVPPIVQLYSVASGSWREIDSSAAPYEIIDRYWSQAFVNGAIHWLASDRQYDNLILSFDMGTEVFGTMKLPPCLVRSFVMDMSIKAFGESLLVVEYDGALFFRESCSIWVMKEYGVAESWSKRCTVSLRGGLGTAVALRKKGEILMSTDDGELVSYHPETQQTKDLGIHGTKDSFYVDNYMETLVLLNNSARDEESKNAD
ncbi:hypothetical protein L1049_024315 [Liquidambar formosana]|uniref:F-box domain-containing protein n=1 Tax=Liquidambar formosana TaxID=63359 RepID=A0AAP0X4S3_LIQFO